MIVAENFMPPIQDLAQNPLGLGIEGQVRHHLGSVSPGERGYSNGRVTSSAPVTFAGIIGAGLYQINVSDSIGYGDRQRARVALDQWTADTGYVVLPIQ